MSKTLLPSLIYSCTLSLILSIFFTYAHAQHGDHGDHGDHGGLPDSFHDSIPLFPEALGPFSWDIQQENPLVQPYFDQGVQLKYAFVVNKVTVR